MGGCSCLVGLVVVGLWRVNLYGSQERGEKVAAVDVFLRQTRQQKGCCWLIGGVSKLRIGCDTAGFNSGDSSEKSDGMSDGWLELARIKVGVIRWDLFG